jgi:Flp pilus assembly protein TadG
MALAQHDPSLFHQRGNVAIEYGLVLPVMLLFILGIVDTGRLLWTYTTLQRAVEAAARCGVVNTTLCASTALIQSKAVTEAWGVPITTSAVTVTTATCGVQVSATYAFTSIIPWFAATAAPSSTLTLTPTACYPV